MFLHFYNYSRIYRCNSAFFISPLPYHINRVVCNIAAHYYKTNKGDNKYASTNLLKINTENKTSKKISLPTLYVVGKRRKIE